MAEGINIPELVKPFMVSISKLNNSNLLNSLATTPELSSGT